MRELILVAAGGSVGASLRYLLGSLVQQAQGVAPEWGTLAANILGSLCLGALFGILATRSPVVNSAYWTFFGVGMLGSFTTFSTFSRDVVGLLAASEILLAMGLIVLSVAGSLTAFWVGTLIAKAF